ncbi:MAG: SOS response-associated peptidase [Alphaproteobacteria bacterium]
MCGRFVQKTPLDDIRELFETVNPVPNAAANYNGAPTQSLAVVRLDPDGRRSLDLLRWGLIPFWAKDKSIGSRLINAMSETVAAKPAFRDAFRRRRCLVPADFFYEWQKTGGGKQPYAIGLADGSPMALAGLWERWNDPEDGATLHSFTVITGPPNELVAPIHNRMPVVLPRQAWRSWLGEDRAETDELPALLRPYPAAAMRACKVGTRVGNVRNNDPELLMPAAA